MKRPLQSRQARVIQPPRTTDSPYLTAQEALGYLRIGSLTALYRLIAQHGLPHGRIGARYRFDTRDLDLWIRGTTALELIRKRQAS